MVVEDANKGKYYGYRKRRKIEEEKENKGKRGPSKVLENDPLHASQKQAAPLAGILHALHKV